MTSPPHESQTLSPFPGLDEDVDYGSDTNMNGDEGKLFNSPVRVVRPLKAPNSFIELVDNNALAVQHHNIFQLKHHYQPIDSQQELILQREGSTLLRFQMDRLQNRSGYVFPTPDVEERLHQTEVLSLSTWAVALEATSPEDIALHQVLHDRYIESFLTTHTANTRNALRA